MDKKTDFQEVKPKSLNKELIEEGERIIERLDKAFFL
tara:strand:+ start:356 stop:466 length:111 start_codon:yes stop_codon:yes gene_type:complete